tara:strand:+ start:877 stop:1149 length:273 start_codon:yes stop_codon:yes gene_type:complete
MKQRESQVELDIEALREGAITFDGLDDAIIGTGGQYPNDGLVVYSANRIMDLLMKDMDVNYEGACEWFDHNIACLYAGEGTPIIVYEPQS